MTDHSGHSEAADEQRARAEKALAVLREVYDYMCEVEGAHAACCAVRSYLSLPRTEDERKAIGERARALLGLENNEWGDYDDEIGGVDA